LFVEFGGVHGGVLDVGFGTGSLTFAAAENKDVSRIVGLDASTGFIEYARSRNVNPRVRFEVGDAQDLPFPDAAFNSCLSALIVSFIRMRLRLSERCGELRDRLASLLRACDCVPH
jgi:ubiquinone/menaquinone biosynthesis C-methylase UbiE